MKSKRINWIRSFSSQWLSSAHAGMQTKKSHKEEIHTFIFPQVRAKIPVEMLWFWFVYVYFSTVLANFVLHIFAFSFKALV